LRQRRRRRRRRNGSLFIDNLYKYGLQCCRRAEAARPERMPGCAASRGARKRHQRNHGQVPSALQVFNLKREFRAGPALDESLRTGTRRAARPSRPRLISRPAVASPPLCVRFRAFRGQVGWHVPGIDARQPRILDSGHFLKEGYFPLQTRVLRLQPHTGNAIIAPPDAPDANMSRHDDERPDQENERPSDQWDKERDGRDPRVPRFGRLVRRFAILACCHGSHAMVFGRLL
jgi:hypothetical protein